MGLTKLAITRPIVILMLFLAIIVMGLKSRSGMPVDLYPKIDVPYVVIQTIYAGAGPEEIETLVSKPLEDAVGSVNGMKNITSTSQEGISVVAIEFELGTNLDSAMADVRAKVDAAAMTLPTDAKTPVVTKIDIGAAPILSLGMSSNRPVRELRMLADDTIKDRLGKIKGVAAVNITGGDIREIQVNVDKSRLEAYGLSIGQISQALANGNMNAPSGRITEGNRDYSVRAVGEFTSMDEIRNLKIKIAGTNGNPDRVLCIGDIADVKDSSAEREADSRLQNKDSIGIDIQKQSDANTVEVADGVKKELDSMKGILPSDVQIAVAYDQSTKVKEALDDVNMSLLLGALLAVLVVFIFLHNIRGTMIVAIAIPTSMVAAFIPIFFMGFTTNMMVMLGLSLAVGILVDDSIVVLENIYRHLAQGDSPEEAAIKGRSEIGLAAVTITMVDCVVFLPIAFMGGMVGQFFREFGITVAAATLFSLFVSFTLTPMLASKWYRKGEAMEAKKGFFAKFDEGYHKVNRRYHGILVWALGHRWTVILIGIGLLADVVLALMRPMVLAAVSKNWPKILVVILILAALITLIIRYFRISVRVDRTWTKLVMGFALLSMVVFFFTPGIGGEFSPKSDSGLVQVAVEMPAGSSLASTNTVVRQIEAVTSKIPEVEYVSTTVGSSTSGHSTQTGPNYALVKASLYEKESVSDRILRVLHLGKQKRTRSDQAIAAELREKTAGIAGGRIMTSVQSSMGGGGSPITIELTGGSDDQRNKVAAQVKQILTSTEGVLNPDISWKVGKPEVRASIDRERAADLGFTMGQIASALRTSIAGNTDTKFRSNGKEYDINVRLKEFDRYSLPDVGRTIIGASNGMPIFLQDVASISYSTGPTKIQRKNKQRLVSVTADLTPGYPIANVQAKLTPKIAKVALNGVQLNWGGEAQSMAESGMNLVFALLLAILLVYMLMAALFESMLNPLVIMFSLPMALIGALLALAVTGETLSIISMIGIIMLMGLVTKNSILLIDYTNTLRSRGKERNEAVLEAGPTRLRPILMTTFAMIFGMLPSAMKLGRGSEMRAPMAIAVIGGLIVSTVLTLVMIPTLYTLMDDFVIWWHRMWRRSGEYEGPGSNGGSHGSHESTVRVSDLVDTEVTSNE